MCFNVYKGKELIANKDIECFKFLRKDVGQRRLHAPYIDEFYYDFKKIYFLNKPLVIIRRKNNKLIFEGFHSYINKDDSKIKALLKKKSTGYRARAYPIDIPVLCIIPKGSKYYRNTDDGEYVSDSIIIKEILYKN